MNSRTAIKTIGTHPYKDSKHWRALLSSIELMEQSSTEALQDADYLTSILSKIAHSTTPELIKINNNHPLTSSQNPQELAHALIQLSSFPIKHFSELGSLLGGTSILISTYLKKFNPDLKVTIVHKDIDIPCFRLLEKVLEAYHVTDIKNLNSKNSNFDLCLIGPMEHLKEIQELYDFASKKAQICMFHHIHHGYHLENFALTPLLSSEGIVKFWENLKTKMKSHSHFFEYSFSYGKEASQGIGLQILSK